MLPQKSKKRYAYFEKFCLRTPLFPVSFYQSLTQNGIVSLQQFREVWENQIVKEAIFLASPHLYSELEKNLENSKNRIKPQLLHTFLKYISRMSSRCTPFGLFAGCSIGSLANTTKIELDNPEKFKRQTRFDMNFLIALSKSLSKETSIKNQLLFYPNTSIYPAGKYQRYIEYTYENNQRIHSIEAISNTPYLQKIHTLARSGKRLSELTTCIASDDITPEEASEFVDELVANQLLVSELEPSVSGEDFLDQIIDKLKAIKYNGFFKGDSYKQMLGKLDEEMGNSVSNYKDIVNNIEISGVPFEQEYLFQTDLYPKSHANTLSKETMSGIKRALVLLNKLTPKDTKTNLDHFRTAFVNRYEQREVPLSLALDTEMGIGYIQNHEVADDAPILDDLELPVRNNNLEQRPKQAPHLAVLQRKLEHGLKKANYTLELGDDDFKGFEENWTDLPDTISMFAEVVYLKGVERVYMNAAGGSTATNFMARFCYDDNDIHKHCKEIVAKEKSLQQEGILAEIVHLPQDRTGNVLRRPVFREFEIPYLGKSNLPISQQITIEDLMISVQGKRIVLRSKKYNKEVIPRLSNAHNYKLNSLPVYQFLCEMQYQNLRGRIEFNWGELAHYHPFLPRVTYENCILSKAIWRVHLKDIDPLIKSIKQHDELMQSVKKWQTLWQIPQLVQLVEHDNKLLVNLNNITSVQMLLNTIKKRERFVLEEFLFAEKGIAKEGNKYYSNELVLSFYKVSD